MIILNQYKLIGQTLNEGATMTTSLTPPAINPTNFLELTKQAVGILGADRNALSEDAADLYLAISKYAAIISAQAFLNAYPEETNVEKELIANLKDYQENHLPTLRSFDLGMFGHLHD